MKKQQDMELDIHPDKNRLDEEWGKQPKLRLAYSRMWADAREDLTTANGELEVEEAELKLAIRLDPEKFGLVTKVTEDGVMSTLVLQDGYKAAKAKVRECQHAVDVLKGAMDSIDDRRTTLENWVKLWLGDYFASPGASGEARERMHEVEKASVRRKGRRVRNDD